MKMKKFIFNKERETEKMVKIKKETRQNQKTLSLGR